MSGDNWGQLFKASKSGDFSSFGKLLTKIERSSVKDALSVPELTQTTQKAFRIGITGPPGAGKSTLVGQFLSSFKKEGLKIGVLAVDPSSPFSKGAILGDRIRYLEHFLDENIFIRSIGSRGSLGGLTGSAYLMLRAFDAVGFDLVLIETVGVGQTELEIVNVADHISVIFVPESGDSIQAMKAGLTEIGDLFIVNKSDRPGSDLIKRELEISLSLSERTAHCPIFNTVASKGEGVSEVIEALLKAYRSGDYSNRRLNPERLRHEAKALMRAEIEKELEEKVSRINNEEDLLKLF